MEMFTMFYYLKYGMSEIVAAPNVDTLQRFRDDDQGITIEMFRACTDNTYVVNTSVVDHRVFVGQTMEAIKHISNSDNNVDNVDYYDVQNME